MLAKTNRIVRGADYRVTVRRGARITAPNTVTYVRRTSSDAVRFGFIVSKAVGVAVIRNRVRRRLKAASYLMVDELGDGYDIVVRALPASAQAPWASLQEELCRAVDKVGAR